SGAAGAHTIVSQAESAWRGRGGPAHAVQTGGPRWVAAARDHGAPGARPDEHSLRASHVRQRDGRGGRADGVRRGLLRYRASSGHAAARGGPPVRERDARGPREHVAGPGRYDRGDDRGHLSGRKPLLTAYFLPLLVALSSRGATATRDLAGVTRGPATSTAGEIPRRCRSSG